MDATNLPPIRKIGPALLPKPKNIKIHAGRIIRLDDFNGKNINTNDNDDEKENSFKKNTSATTSSSDATANTQIESNSNINNNKQMENLSKSSHEAKQYTGSGITLNEYEPEHNLSQSDKSSATSESNFDRSSVDSTNRNSFDFPPPPPSSLTSDENMSRYAVHAHKDNNDDISNKLSTINLSADASSRPVITITPRQPITSLEKEKLVYNIPVQHLPAPSQHKNLQLIRDTQSPTHQLIKKQQDSPKATNILVTNKSASPQIGLSNNVSLNENPSKLIDDHVDLLMKNLIASKEENFQGVCYKCKDRILGSESGLKAMDQLFHAACFNCFSCNNFLKDKHFYAIENKSYCESCYIDILEKCNICMKPIMDRILRATGKPYHPECFCCSECSHNLDGIPFTVDARNKIHCIKCFHEKYAPRCYMCQKPITPDPGHEETTRIVAMDKSFHVACYKCEDCGISLTSSGDKTSACYPLDNHVYCKSCSLQRMKRNVKLISPQLTSSGMTPRTTDL